MDNLFLPEEFETSTIGEKPDTDATEWVLIEPEETAPPAETPAQAVV
jgi:hypothetical protein